MFVSSLPKVRRQKKYGAGFTAGGLLYDEFVSVLPLLNPVVMTDRLMAEVGENRYMAIRTVGARKRVLREMLRRMNEVDQDFWQHFLNWNEGERKLALYFLCLNTYSIVFELHWELARKKWATGSTMSAFDVQMFLEQVQSRRGNDVGNWSALTLNKINQQFRKALRDCGLLKGDLLNQPERVSPDFWSYFERGEYRWFLEACFIF